jgi:hypothetical protein
MRERRKGIQHSPAEKLSEATSKPQGADAAKSARNGEKPLRDAMALDPIVNEIMIRRIMAALMSAE